jgi:S-adenosylmethionine:tRNA ribosyltransferase-isomerase
VESHQVDPEEYSVSADSASLLNDTRAAGRRVIAVGTTTVRVLETQYRDGDYRAGQGATRLGIFPPYEFRAVDALVCAFAGKDLTLEAYRYAVEKEFRFYSYGDAMLIV